jgi:hypothetical protein
LNNGKIDKGYINNNELIHSLTDGIMGIAEQMLFLNSKDLVLLVEGNTDKTHIETALHKLKDDYKYLEFDVFSMGGADNIQRFILGGKKSDLFDRNKQYIAIFDNDVKGKECHNKVNGKTKDNSLFNSLLISDKKEYEIENLYPEKIQKKSYQTVIKNMNKNFNGKFIEEEVKKDLAIKCHTFDKSDFKGFKVLFDKILSIKEKANK